MWWMGLTQAAMAGIEGGAAYAASSASAKAQKKWQKYRNNMLALTAGESVNDITTNVSLAQVASGEAAVQIQRQEALSEGAATVAAAAAGVKGGSVNATMLDIQRNAANQEDKRIQQLNNVYLQADQQVRDVELNKSMSMDYSTISGPSLLSTVLGVGAKDLSIYDHYQQNGYVDELRKSISGLVSG